MNTTLTHLDVSKLQHKCVIETQDGVEINLADFVHHSCRPVIEALMLAGLIERKDSFGFALASIDLEEIEREWDNPDRLVAMVVYWGPDGERYAANAVRKLRPAARNAEDSQRIRVKYPQLFLDPVKSVEEDGTFAWGDFPFDGAVWHHDSWVHLLGAVSAYPKEQDPIVASLILGILAEVLRKAFHA